MEKEIVSVLNKILDNNYQAYLIGGYVRDKLLGINSYDIDIVTNASPKKLFEIFNIKPSKYGTIKMVNNKYHFDIATLRKEISYENNKPNKIIYINDFKEDLLRRDFTINTILMDRDGQIIDYLNGVSDLHNKVIKSVGNVNEKFLEDPSRILRALRLAITLDFKLDDELLRSLKKNINLINNISKDKVRLEFDKIISCSNSIKGLETLKKLNVLNILNISYESITSVDNNIGMYAQMSLNDYPLTKNEKNSIKSIKEIINIGYINNKVLFDYGLDQSIIAAKILNINPKEIISMYDNLTIKSKSDLNITFEEVKNILNTSRVSLVKNTINDIINMILTKNLENDKIKIIKYLKERNKTNE